MSRRKAHAARQAVAGTGECERYAWQKVLLVGNASTGKTSIRTRLSQGDFLEVWAPTLLLNFATWCPKLDDKEVRVELFDMAGRERFRSLVRDYYRVTDFFVIVYSVTDRASFEIGAKEWLEELKSHDFSGRQPRFLLLGNKCDRRRERTVSYMEAKDFADENDLMFFEVSAKEGTNLELAFMSFVHNNLKRWRG